MIEGVTVGRATDWAGLQVMAPTRVAAPANPAERFMNSTLRWRGGDGGGSGRAGPGWSNLLLIVAIGLVAVVVVVWMVAFGRAEALGRTVEERIASLCRLADERPRGAGEAVMTVAKGDPDASVRAAALVALSKFIEEPDYRPIVESAVDDPDPRVRAAAAATLGLYRDEAAVDKLRELLSSDASEQVRFAAARGLMRTGSQRAILVLVEAMASNDNPNVQHRAMEVLTDSFNISFATPVDPRDRAAWAKRVAVMRGIPTVRLAREAVERSRGDR